MKTLTEDLIESDETRRFDLFNEVIDIFKMSLWRTKDHLQFEDYFVYKADPKLSSAIIDRLVPNKDMVDQTYLYRLVYMCSESAEARRLFLALNKKETEALCNITTIEWSSPEHFADWLFLQKISGKWDLAVNNVRLNLSAVMMPNQWSSTRGVLERGETLRHFESILPKNPKIRGMEVSVWNLLNIYDLETFTEFAKVYVQENPELSLSDMDKILLNWGDYHDYPLEWQAHIVEPRVIDDSAFLHTYDDPWKAWIE